MMTNFRGRGGGQLQYFLNREIIYIVRTLAGVGPKRPLVADRRKGIVGRWSSDQLDGGYLTGRWDRRLCRDCTRKPSGNRHHWLHGRTTGHRRRETDRPHGIDHHGEPEGK